MKTAIQIKPNDNVATVTDDVEPGEEVRISGIREDHLVTTNEAIRAGHKIALRAIEAGEEILKYGEVIGAATEAIPEGGWVHVQNCRGIKARRHGTAA